MAETPQAPSWIMVEKEAGPATKEALRLLWLQMNKPAPSLPDVRFIGAPIQTGMVIAYAGDTNPDPAEYGICDHHEESRVTRAALFARIGTRYGIGDGSTTFNVPDYRKRPVVGTDARDPDFAEPGKAGGAILTTLTVPAHNHPFSATTDSVGDHAHGVVGNTANATTGITASANPSTVNVESDAIVPVSVVDDVGGIDITESAHLHGVNITSASAGGHNHPVSGTSDNAAAVSLSVTAPHVTGLYLIKY